MFFPEYSITSEILKNISNIDFARGVIETVPILPNWESQIKKDAQIKTVINTLKQDHLNASYDEVKKEMDGFNTNLSKEALGLIQGIQKIETTYSTRELDEDILKEIHTLISKDNVPNLKQGIYRSKRIQGATDPQEVLAEIVDFFDWYNGRDAKETHPILLAGILHGTLNRIIPFESSNSNVVTLATMISLKGTGYAVKGYVPLVPEKALNAVLGIGREDLTEYLQAYTEYLSSEFLNVKEKVVLLGRNTKVAKATGHARLTQRQQRIVEYLQDYGILKNADFPKIFPGISEDSILRDLKLLLKDEIVVKQGSTKSSFYELR